MRNYLWINEILFFCRFNYKAIQIVSMLMKKKTFEVSINKKILEHNKLNVPVL